MELRQGVELRADGRTLTGPAVRYGEVSPSHRERFERGAFNVSPDLAPTLGHRTGRVLAYGDDVRVEDRADALVVSAHLPRTETAAIALDGVKSGRYRGWSIEFKARSESRDAAGIRVVTVADLPGLALVDHPSYPGSVVETRQRGGFRTRLKPNRKMDCKCAGQGAGKGVRRIRFDDGAFDDVLEAVADGSRNVSAIGRGAGDVVADTATGSLRLRRPTGGGLAVGVTALDTEAGRCFAELVDAGVAVHARPVIDFDAATYTVDGDTATVSAAAFDFILVKPTPNARGLDPLEPVARPENRGGLVRVEPLLPVAAPTTLPETRIRPWL